MNLPTSRNEASKNGSESPLMFIFCTSKDIGKLSKGVTGSVS